MRTLPLCSSLFALVLSTAGCSSDPGANDPDLGTMPDAGTPDQGTGDPLFPAPAGSVQAVEVQTPYGMVDELTAAFFDSEKVSFHREEQRIGACRLLTFKPAQCDSFCIGVCVERNVCKPYPSRLSAGKIQYSGLKVPVSLSPQFGNYYYADPPITGDLFDAGAAVSVAAAGGEFAGFSASGIGVATLEATSVVDDEIKLEDTADYVFTWKPGSDPRARLRLTINANNRGHGAPYEGIIECDAPDTGSLTIAKELIVPFPDTFRWEICAGRDCPLSDALRYTVSEAQAGSRRVSFIVGSRRSFWVLHRAP